MCKQTMQYRQGIYVFFFLIHFFFFFRIFINTVVIHHMSRFYHSLLCMKDVCTMN